MIGWADIDALAQEMASLKNKEAHVMIAERLGLAGIPYNKLWRLRPIVWELRKHYRPRSVLKAPIEELRALVEEICGRTP